jgi:hypothetical protein
MPKPNPRAGEVATALGYDFVPLPTFVVAARERGEISDVEFLTITVVYRRASYSKLARREETPRLSRKALMDAVGWTQQPESFSRMLVRLRGRGFLPYRVVRRGNHFVYIFRLNPHRGRRRV